MNQPTPLRTPFLRTPTSALACIRIVLSHPSHPGNIGAAARALKTMGLARLILVQPRLFPHAEAAAMATGASDVLAAARVVDTLDEALNGAVFSVGMTARRRDLSHPIVALREAAQRIVEETAQGDVAIVFGTEMSGLSNPELERCQLAANIPADPDYSSLNLGAAVQVVAYEIAQAAQAWKPKQTDPRHPASHEEIEAFYAYLEQSMIETGFLNPERPKRLMTRVRRLFARAQLEREELNILRGILAARQRKAGE